jgi:hypothetical protein
MSKKLITACLAVVAFAALALPAIASATNSPLLTEPTGSSLAIGSKITGTNVGNPVLTGADKKTVLTECTKSTLTGELTKNESGSVEGNLTFATFSGTGPALNGEPECTSPGAAALGNFGVDTEIGNGVPWCLRSTAAMAEDEFQVRGGKCGEEARSITFVLTSTVIGLANPCKYNRTEPISGTFTTDTGTTQDAVLTIKDARFLKESGPVTCPAEGYFDASYTLETDEATVKPIYVS